MDEHLIGHHLQREHAKSSMQQPRECAIDHVILTGRPTEWRPGR